MRAFASLLLPIILLGFSFAAPARGDEGDAASASKGKRKVMRYRKTQAVGRAVGKVVKDIAHRVAEAVGAILPSGTPRPATTSDSAPPSSASGSSGGGSWGDEAETAKTAAQTEAEPVVKDALTGLFASDEGEETAQDARSVHLSYPCTSCSEFENGIIVLKSTPGSYFSVCGFNGGYFGLQELSDGRKVVIFSVWDPGRQDDPNVVPEDRQVRVKAHGSKVEISRFGNEGTGAKSMLPYPWKTGVAYRFRLRTRLCSDGWTEVSASFGEASGRNTRFMATMEAMMDGRRLEGLYSFVEDFRRDGVSAGEIRKALFLRGWTRSEGSKDRLPIREARFTAWSPHPSDAIDAGIMKGGFYLQNGGDTKRSRKVDSSMILP